MVSRLAAFCWRLFLRRKGCYALRAGLVIVLDSIILCTAVQVGWLRHRELWLTSIGTFRKWRPVCKYPNTERDQRETADGLPTGNVTSKTSELTKYASLGRKGD